jgi:hypothetical protein
MRRKDALGMCFTLEHKYYKTDLSKKKIARNIYI